MTLAKRFSDIQTVRPCDGWYLVKLKKYNRRWNLPKAGFLNSILSYEWKKMIFRNFWTIISNASYQDSSAACVFYNIFIYLVLVILVLAAVAQAVVILLFLVGLCFGGICAISGKVNDEKKHDEIIEAKEPNEINEFPWRMKLTYFFTSKNSVTVPTYYFKISTMT